VMEGQGYKGQPRTPSSGDGRKRQKTQEKAVR